MTTAVHQADESPLPDQRRDAASWALTAATVLALTVGVLVIRSTRSEPPAQRPPTMAGREEALPGLEVPRPQEPIVALPIDREDTGQGPQTAAQVYGSEGTGQL